MAKSLRNIGNDICGVLAIGISVFIAISLTTYNKWDPSPFTFTDMLPKNYGGIFGAYISDVLFSVFGNVSYFMPIMLFYYGVRRLFRIGKKKENIVGAILLFFSAAFLISMFVFVFDVPFINGGLVGSSFTYFFTSTFSVVGGFIISLSLFYTSIILVMPFNIVTSRVERKRRKFSRREFSDYRPKEGISRSVFVNNGYKPVDIDVRQDKYVTKNTISKDIIENGMDEKDSIERSIFEQDNDNKDEPYGNSTVMDLEDGEQREFNSALEMDSSKVEKVEQEGFVNSLNMDTEDVNREGVDDNLSMDSETIEQDEFYSNLSVNPEDVEQDELDNNLNMDLESVKQEELLNGGSGDFVHEELETDLEDVKQEEINNDLNFDPKDVNNEEPENALNIDEEDTRQEEVYSNLNENSSLEADVHNNDVELKKLPKDNDEYKKDDTKEIEEVEKFNVVKNANLTEFPSKESVKTHSIFSDSEDEDIFGSDSEEEIQRIIERESKQNFRVGQYVMPTVNFLNKNLDVNKGISYDELQESAQVLNRKLSDFNVNGKIVQVHPGPIISMYEFEPAPGVKISKVVSLSDDLGRAMGGIKVRVTLIPGKTTIGIEVPNEKRVIVTLGEIIVSDMFQKRSSLLTLSLGKDIYGNPVAEDLTRMPHLLVAGTTGSGKSVAINAMIISILYKAKPSEVKMLMIDPKLLELSIYEGIPHLLTGVITNPKEAADALKKMLLEMERRYRLIAEQGVRNIEMYNASVADEDKLPFIVIVIDELADLMFTSSKSVEESIVRLAQMARAAGIHLILATQRPSVDVITGIIKANFPSRIAFQVTSKVDSRTILDTHGAEKLLGRGDMLMLSAGAKILRVHGAYVSDSEVKAVTDFVKAQGEPDYNIFESLSTIPEPLDEKKAKKDVLFDDILHYARSMGEVSISSIQRRFKIGYNRAARIMDMFEEDGLVGPSKGAGKPRDFIDR